MGKYSEGKSCRRGSALNELLSTGGENYFRESWMQRKIFFLLIAAFLMLAGVRDAEAKKGFYLGLGTAYNTIHGDFTGSDGLQGGNEIIILPQITSAFGIDILAGYGINDQWAIELNLMSSKHSGSWTNLSGDVSYTSFSVNGKYSFIPSDAVQPYLLFGISNNVLLIKGGAKDTATGKVSDAVLQGLGLDLGTGIDRYLSPHVSLNLGIMYRIVDYTWATGVERSGKIDKAVNGSGFSFLLTGAYHF
jgi:opacity protein-like surface antigen